jgi:lysozyme family protein
VRADGKIGPITRAAIANADEDTLLLDFLSHRLRAYSKTRNASRYMRGWSRRVLALYAHVLTIQ